jgi:hypothetical protein
MILPVGFPDEHVRQAYTNPLVDKSNEKFEWVVPDLDGLRTYARSVFHWDEERINGILLPIMQIVAGKVQTTMGLWLWFGRRNNPLPPPPPRPGRVGQ